MLEPSASPGVDTVGGGDMNLKGGTPLRLWCGIVGKTRLALFRDISIKTIWDEMEFVRSCGEL